MHNLIQDLRYSFRMFAKNPGSTAVMLLTLALGIGGNTAIFSVINNAFFRPLPFKDEAALVRLRDYAVSSNGERSTFNTSDRNFYFIRENNRVFSGTVSQRGQSFTLTGGEAPERVSVASVSSGSWSTLGVQAVLGRTFNAEEERLGSESGVALISHKLWQRRFGGDSGMLGKSLALDERSYTVVGVLPQGYNFPYDADIWVPARVDPSRDDDSAVFARLKPGVSLEQARAEMKQIAAKIVQQYPDTNPGYGIDITPLRESLLDDQHRVALLLFALVGLFLLIACVNVANLLLARSVTRQKELAIRAALGASRRRLIGQLLSESIALAIFGGFCGILITLWVSRYLTVLVPSNFTDQLSLSDVTIDLRVLCFTLAASILTGVFFGLAPAIRISNPDLQTFLKDGGRLSGAGGKSHRLLSTLAVSEIALALVLLAGAALMIRNIEHLLKQNLGFEPENLLTMQITLPQSRYSAEQKRGNAVKEILQNIERLPGVDSVGLTTVNPLGGGTWWAPIVAEGVATDRKNRAFFINDRLVNPQFFQAMRIPLLKGRLFDAQDAERSQEVVIISEKLARYLWPTEDPIGKRVRLAGPRENWRTIVGVVGDVRDTGEVDKTWYLPYFQHASTGFAENIHLMIRSRTDPRSLNRSIQEAVWSVDRNLAIYKTSTMDKYYSNTLSQDRLGAVLTTIFATFGLILAALGIYGVVSYAVGQRTHEIGIRLALGARPADIFQLVMRQGIMIVLKGTIIGTAATFILKRILSSLIQGLGAIDPVTFTAILLLLTGVVLLAVFIPARRASNVSPVVALRQE